MLFGTDFVAGSYMTRKLISETLRQFHTIPYWNPYIYGGVPLGDALAGGDLFYPLSFLLRVFLPPHTVPVWLLGLHFTLAGIFMYLLIRELGLGRVPASISAFSYMFTGQIVSLIYAGHDGKIVVSCLLPGLFWVIHRGVRLARWREFIWAGGILGCVFLSPHIQMAYYSLLATGLFWLVLLIWKLRKEKKAKVFIKAGVGFVIFLVLGFSLAAIQYLPFYSYIPYSPRGGGEGRGIEFAKSWSMPPEETIDALVPDFSGMSIGNTPYDTYWGRNIFKLHSEYLGVLPVLLAVLGIVLGRRSRYVLLFLALIILGYLFAWGAFTPVFYLFYYLLPYYKKLRGASMSFFLVSFSTACLAGFGAEQLVVSAEEKKVAKEGSKRNRNLILGLGVSAGAVLLLNLIISSARDGVIPFLGNNFISESDKYQQLQANYGHFINGTFLFTLFLIFEAILLILLIRKILPKTWWAGLAIGLMVIDLWHIDLRFRQIVPSPPQYLGFEKDEVVRVLEQDSSLYRVFPLQYDKMGSYLSLFDIQNIRGEHPNPLKRYTEFVGSGKTGNVDVHNLLDKPNFLNLLNTKYLITANRVEDLAQRFRFVLPTLKLVSDGTFKVYENLDVLPRAFCVGKYELNRNSDQILERIGQPEFNPAKVVILEEDPGLRFSAQDSSLHWSVNILRDTIPRDNLIIDDPNRVVLNCETSVPSFLILSQNHYPAWKAYIDGRPTKVFRADYTFCAVSLPVGKHQVAFRYESRQYQLGLKISLFALFILVLSLLVPFFKLLGLRIKGNQSL